MGGAAARSPDVDRVGRQRTFRQDVRGASASSVAVIGFLGRCSLAWPSAPFPLIGYHLGRLTTDETPEHALELGCNRSIERQPNGRNITVL